MISDPGNFKEEMGADILDYETNKSVPFTLDICFKVHKFSRLELRLYLMTRKKTVWSHSS